MIDVRKIGLIAIAFASCAAAQPGGKPAGEPDIAAILARMGAGESQMQGAELERAIAAAAAHPLGSRDNPVRASTPSGQRAYLARLRCAEGGAPRFERSGNLGPGIYGNIVDAYQVTCRGAEAVTVVMDMYHRGHVEDRPVPGFEIVPD